MTEYAALDKTGPRRRKNPLTGEWVLVSPGRLARPWQGAEGFTEPVAPPSHDPLCFLCPGNTRQSGAINPKYRGPFVFSNDFPALSTGADEVFEDPEPDGLMENERVSGECLVVCYSADHAAHFEQLGLAATESVVEVWSELTEQQHRAYQWVQVFENRGAAMGASSPHPHSQVWATSYLPTLALREGQAQSSYHARTGRTLIADYLQAEQRIGDRVVYDNEQWVAVVPYWAAWPYELLLVPTRPAGRLDALDARQSTSLAETLIAIARLYDNVFGVQFPYTFGWHQAPAADRDSWQLHAHYYPPLLRSSTVRKHMVGFELLCEMQRDMTPETAAEHLRAAANSDGSGSRSAAQTLEACRH